MTDHSIVWRDRIRASVGRWVVGVARKGPGRRRFVDPYLSRSATGLIGLALFDSAALAQRYITEMDLSGWRPCYLDYALLHELLERLVEEGCESTLVMRDPPSGSRLLSLRSDHEQPALMLGDLMARLEPHAGADEAVEVEWRLIFFDRDDLAAVLGAQDKRVSSAGAA